MPEDPMSIAASLGPEVMDLLRRGGDLLQHEPKTWADVERAALHDPILHRLVYAVRAGIVEREQGLMVVALELSKMNTALLKDNGDLLARLPARITIP